MSLRILHVASEVYPLVKTGGLADVVGSLPVAQRRLGQRVTVLVPGYPAVKTGAGKLEVIDTLQTPFAVEARLLRGRLGSGVELLVIDAPSFFDRPGNPYISPEGHDWPDNHRRFALLGWVAAWLCAGTGRFDLVHAHDWHAGLTAAYLQVGNSGVPCCFTIHNLAYQGRFGVQSYADTHLPWELYRFDGLEYHGDWSFMKAALSFSDRITTVSPSYAREILKPSHGAGLDTVLRHRRKQLHGILNGVDYQVWNPRTDPALVHHYSMDSLDNKARNKRDLQRGLGLQQAGDRPMVCIVSRLSEQKGLDLVPEAVEGLLASDKMQLVLLGTGEPHLERVFGEFGRRHAGNCSVMIDYNEKISHRLIAGSDAILVPSRFEPCGLTQMYGLCYGTLPVVRRTGGLADSVAGYHGRNRRQATGFDFQTASVNALRRCLGQVINTYRDAALWRQLVRNAMRQEFGWDRAASAYRDLYLQMSGKP